MPFFLLVFLFIGVPIAEITLLIRVGSSIGVLNTIAFVVFTAVLGAYLVRKQGLETVNKLQQETNAGRVPAMQIAEGVALLFAGAVLMTPGFITDALGFALLIPQVRQALIAWSATNLFKGQVHTAYTNPTSPSRQSVDNGDVIEGEYTSHSDDSK
jgi:UPF0716 protein FxsA